jgi:hypothetical protein
MRIRHGLLAVLAAGSVLATGAARADRLDKELDRRMPDLLAGLKKKYKAAGVLPFRVQEGAGRESLTAPLCGRMAERVETLLMIHNGPDETKALGLVRDVTPPRSGDRESLFRNRYPLAWGSAKVRPDVFLTGKVTLSKDRRTTEVALEAFDRGSPRTTRLLARFDFPTDAAVLRELGHSFVLSRDAREKLRGGRGAFDELLIGEAGAKGQANKKPGAAKEATTPRKAAPEAGGPRDIGGIAFEMLVGDAQEPAAIQRSAASADNVRFEVMSPRVKEKVAFRLRNTTGKTLGVVLQLNGVNTLFEQKLPPEQAAKWKVQPRERLVVDGFHSKEGVKRVEVLVDAAAERLGDKKGLIEIDVFEEAGGKKGDAKPDGEKLFSARGLPPSKQRLARESYQGLRSALLKSAELKSVVKKEVVAGKVLMREALVPAEKTEKGPGLKQEDFVNPVPVARLVIKIYRNDEMKAD